MDNHQVADDDWVDIPSQTADSSENDWEDIPSDDDWEDIPSTSPMQTVKQVGADVLKGASRLGGIAVGAVNAPLAFGKGFAEGYSEAPRPRPGAIENYLPMGSPEQIKSGLKSGVKSAKASITEKGGWGSTWSDVWKSKTGLSMQEGMVRSFTKMGVPDPEALATQMAPVLEGVLDLAASPTISGGVAAKTLKSSEYATDLIDVAAKLIRDINKVPENFKRVLSPKILEQIKQLDAEDKIETLAEYLERQEFFKEFESEGQRAKQQMDALKSHWGKLEETEGGIKADKDRLAAKEREQIAEEVANRPQPLKAAIPQTEGAIVRQPITEEQQAVVNQAQQELMDRIRDKREREIALGKAQVGVTTNRPGPLITRGITPGEKAAIPDSGAITRQPITKEEVESGRLAQEEFNRRLLNKREREITLAKAQTGVTQNQPTPLIRREIIPGEKAAIPGIGEFMQRSKSDDLKKKGRLARLVGEGEEPGRPVQVETGGAEETQPSGILQAPEGKVAPEIEPERLPVTAPEIMPEPMPSRVGEIEAEVDRLTGKGEAPVETPAAPAPKAKEFWEMTAVEASRVTGLGFDKWADSITEAWKSGKLTEDSPQVKSMMRTKPRDFGEIWAVENGKMAANPDLLTRHPDLAAKAKSETAPLPPQSTQAAGPAPTIPKGGNVEPRANTKTAVFNLGREVSFRISSKSGRTLRPTTGDIKDAAEFLGIPQADARKALDFYNHGHTYEDGALPKLNWSKHQKKAEVALLKSPAEASGFMAGLEQDEETGEWKYDFNKGLAAALGVHVGAGIIRTKSLKNKQIVADLEKKYPAGMKSAKQMIEEPTQAFNLVGTLSRGWDAYRRAFTDRFAALEKASPKTYEDAIKYNSFKDRANVAFDDLADKLKALGINEHEGTFTLYMKAKRDYDRLSSGIKTGDMTLDGAKKAMDDWKKAFQEEGGDTANLDKGAQAFQDFTVEHLLGRFRDSGVISQEAFDSIKQKNKSYLTYNVLHHLDDIEKFNSGYSTSGIFSVGQQKEVRKMTGMSEGSVIENPIEATVKKFMSIQAVAARNDVARSLIDDVGVDKIRLAESFAELNAAKSKNPKANVILRDNWEKQYSKQEWDTVSAYRDGKVETYLVNKNLAEAMKINNLMGNPIQKWKPVMAVVNVLNDIYRQTATTLAPWFWIRNAPRDAFMAYVTSPVYGVTDIAGKFQKDWLKGAWEGLKHELGKPSLVDDHIKHGGGFGYASKEAFDVTGKPKVSGRLFDKSKAQKAVDLFTLKKPRDIMTAINEIVELAPRIGIKERAGIIGKTADEASMLGRRGTIDFNRGGWLVKTLNQFIPFLNARFQGKSNLYAALKRDPVGTSSKIFVSTVIPAVSAWAWNRIHYSDLYDDIDERERAKYFVLITGETKDENGNRVPKYYKIAKGDAGELATNAIEFALNNWSEKDLEKAKEFAMEWVSGLSPVEFTRRGEFSLGLTASQMLPPVVKLGAEQAFGKNLYYDKPFVSPYLEKLAKNRPAYQTTEGVPDVYNYLGAKLNFPPSRMKNIAEGFFTGIGGAGFEPVGLVKKTISSVYQEKGGQIARDAADMIVSIENEYNGVKMDVDRMLKAGKRAEADKAQREWDETAQTLVNEYNAMFSKYGFDDDRKYFLNSVTFRPVRGLPSERIGKMKSLHRKTEEATQEKPVLDTSGFVRKKVKKNR